jgi:hypothetical protein
MRAPTRLLATLVAATVSAAAVGCELPAVRGRVADRESGAPIEGAIVVELWREAGWMGEPAHAEHARFATSDSAGRFEMAAERGPLFGSERPPVWVFAHPEYGLVHAREVEPAGGSVELRGARGEIAAQQALASICESPPREDWERTLASRVCRRR